VSTTNPPQFFISNAEVFYALTVATQSNHQQHHSRWTKMTIL